ncbi:hypothetical protein QYF61_002154 [Mycteria americana]|uniref:Reverse transcriptase domain-containing protein n=1 Tax=Mycteria americana TaxID=33587 RepID=A0AAN7PVG8_MYCAM|nr:hypothetical protein QYF61_002154 [Mycteria americana]
MRRGAPLDLILTNKEKLVGDVKVKGDFGCGDKKMVEFRILRGGRRRRGELDVVYLDFSKAFDTVSQKILIDELLIHGLNEQTVRSIENWLNGWVQRMVISGTKSSWRPGTSSVPQGSILGSILFFINDLDDGTECTCSKFIDDTKLGGVADIPEGHAVIQKDLNRLEKWAVRNLMKLNKGNCKALHLEKNKPMHQNMLGTSHPESSFAGKDLGVLVDTNCT